MAFTDIDAVQSHLITELGYSSDEVIKWLSQFTDPRDIAAILANPIVVIKDFPITHGEALARQARLAVHEDIWDGTED